MSSALASIERAVRVLSDISQGIRGRVVRSRELDAKTINVASQLAGLVEGISGGLRTLEGKLKASGSVEGVSRISPYTYLVVDGERVIVLRSRPEYMVLSIESKGSSISIKTRNSAISIKPDSISITARGVSVEVNPFSVEDYQVKREELRKALKSIDRVVNQRLIQVVEWKT